jgi:cyclopropane fatty-acyl-phospholipid synthase-like methyltransferase
VSRDSQEKLEYFREQYGQRQSEVSGRVEQRALGQDVGGNGYTTIAQAQQLTEALELSTESLLLDLGAGRGWPGTYLGGSSQCRFVLLDLPLEALRQARAYADDRGISSRMSAICAEGTALPFLPCSFDAVVHSDVLC